MRGLGNPRNARVVGGDDAYMLLRIAAFDGAIIQVALKPINCLLARAPKMQVKSASNPGSLKFHGGVHRAAPSGKNSQSRAL